MPFEHDVVEIIHPQTTIFAVMLLGNLFFFKPAPRWVHLAVILGDEFVGANAHRVDADHALSLGVHGPHVVQQNRCIAGSGQGRR